MMPEREEFSKLDIRAASCIERLVKSEEYNATNPLVDIERIADKVFCMKCKNCDVLQSMRIKSVSVKAKNLILLNPLLNPQERKIEIARQLAGIFYSGVNSNIDFLAGSFLLPKFLYEKLSKKKLSPQQVLSCLGFENNEFWIATINYLNEDVPLIMRIQNNLSNLISGAFRYVTVRKINLP